VWSHCRARGPAVTGRKSRIHGATELVLSFSIDQLAGWLALGGIVAAAVAVIVAWQEACPT
jgi:hypothetical protein